MQERRSSHGPGSEAPRAGAPRPDCPRCRHLRITHQPAWPYACTLFAMRTRTLPSIEVERTSGAPCRGFEQKPPSGSKGSGKA